MSDNDVGVDESAAEAPVDDEDAGTDGVTEDEEGFESLEARIEEATTDELADEVRTLRARAADAERSVEERDEEIDELESKLTRKQADFQNYKQRTERQQEELRERATEDLVGRLLDVRDNLSRALSQDEDADIRPGVESTLEEFDRILDEENVTAIEPDAGDAVDPQRHEVMLRVDSDQPEDTIAELYRPGYEMGEKVLRPAQITVSE
ncbi:dnaJ/dnaK ATPase stimulator grpE [Halococcus morrhuae DSM 1307]|uniref:Protein GrpE n=1 Tax=Halococcus morrhuae DSM 1307 TaxID=931277 RepID=M0M3K0_HALMO|nr:nucleotide exchange factor GrpE [Halococcus morrhuae]EMA40387.1 dnaJ/dnaK ATPase stimulator grpE [Halococcus morrhuae DSM 1307]